MLNIKDGSELPFFASVVKQGKVVPNADITLYLDQDLRRLSLYRRAWVLAEYSLIWYTLGFHHLCTRQCCCGNRVVEKWNTYISLKRRVIEEREKDEKVCSKI